MIALWMADQGAKNLIFASRSGLAKQEARELVGVLEDRGVAVAVHTCDISEASQMRNILEHTKHMPPIQGVIQGAMVLKVSLWHFRFDKVD